ncbi:2039_t:CDS:1, partial [Gigaspora margarita]
KSSSTKLQYKKDHITETIDANFAPEEIVEGDSNRIAKSRHHHEPRIKIKRINKIRK